MKNGNITISVPADDVLALTEASSMFLRISTGRLINREVLEPNPTPPAPDTGRTHEVNEQTVPPEPAPAPAPESTGAGFMPAEEPAAPAPAPAPVAVAPAPVAVAPAPAPAPAPDTAHDAPTPGAQVTKGLDGELIPAMLHGVLVDAAGMPWDGRIHSSNQKLLKKAPHNWTPRRGRDVAVVPVVEAELKARMEALAAAPAAAPAPGPAPAPAPAPVAAVAAAAPAPAPFSFADCMVLAKTKGYGTTEQLATLAAQFDLPNGLIAYLPSQPDKIPPMMDFLNTLPTI